MVEKMGQIGQNRNRFYADSVFWRCFARENGYLIGQNRNKREEEIVKNGEIFFVVLCYSRALFCLALFDG
jgi:hypothetical protein